MTFIIACKPLDGELYEEKCYLLNKEVLMIPNLSRRPVVMCVQLYS